MGPRSAPRWWVPQMVPMSWGPRWSAALLVVGLVVELAVESAVGLAVGLESAMESAVGLGKHLLRIWLRGSSCKTPGSCSHRGYNGLRSSHSNSGAWSG